MDVIGHLAGGFAVAFQPLNVLLAFAGVLVGTLVGMLPGIGPINAIAILVPVAFAAGIDPTAAIILLAGIYYGSQYGNSISTILLNVPGTAAAVATALDGHALTRRGRAGPALATAAIASFVGGTTSIFGLAFLAPVLAGWAIRFGPAEYFALMVFAFAALSSLAGENVAKGIVAAGLGLALATIGMDPHSGVARYTFGSPELMDGLDFMVVTIGLFAVSEVFLALEGTGVGAAAAGAVTRVRVGARELAGSIGSMVRGSVLGFFVGVLPGAGGTLASFLAYGVEKTWADPDRRLGTGELRGVAAPEAANNAAVSGAMIPLLTLGVPGSATTAVMLAALLGMNVTPGPLLLETRPELFWGLVASMYVGNVFLLMLNLPLVGLFVRILAAPRWLLMGVVAAVGFVGVYAVNRSTFDLLLVTAFGVVGYALRKAGFPLAPLILGLVLGPLMERNLRRALALSGGDWSVLISSPIAVGLWVAALAGLLLPPVLRRVAPRAVRTPAPARSGESAHGGDPVP